MYRRHFLGALGMATAMGLSRPSLFAGQAIRGDWKSEVVQTVGQAPKFRPPVVTDVAINPAQTQIAVVGDDHVIAIYDLASHEFVRTLRGHADWIRVAKFTPNGRSLITAGNDRKCLIWPSADWEGPFQLPVHPAAIFDADACPQSRLLALVGFEQNLHVIDLATREEIRRLTCSTNDIHCVKFSLDGSRLAAAGRDGNIRVWDTTSFKVVADLPVHRQRVFDISFLSSGQILSGSQDQFVKITDPESGRVITEFPRFAAKLYCVATIDERHIATGGSDNQISVWNVETKQNVATLRGHTGTVSCLACSENLLVSGSYDTQVRIWRREANTNSLEIGDAGNSGWNSRFK